MFSGPPGKEGPLYFIIAFTMEVLFWFLIVPRGLGFPDGRQPLKSYFEKIRFTQIHPIVRNVILGVICALIFLTSGFIFTILTGSYVFDTKQIFPPDSWIILNALVSGIWEEFGFRGVILTMFLRPYNKEKAIILSAVMFSLAHLFNLLGFGISIEAILMVLTQVCYAFFIGMLLAYLVIKTDSLLPGIVIHYLLNAFGPLLTNTPCIDPLFKAIMMIFGAGIVPSLFAFILVRKIFSNTENSEE
ncbi:MAG: lysostaphin resistance A-like protein [Candidatus Hodarchaeota archaeon]